MTEIRDYSNETMRTFEKYGFGVPCSIFHKFIYNYSMHIKSPIPFDLFSSFYKSFSVCSKKKKNKIKSEHRLEMEHSFLHWAIDSICI